MIHAVEKIQRLMSERKQIYDEVTDLGEPAEVMRMRGHRRVPRPRRPLLVAPRWRGDARIDDMRTDHRVDSVVLPGRPAGHPPKYNGVISALWTTGDNPSR